MSFQWTPSTGLNDPSAFPAQDKGFRARLQALLDQAKNAINTKADITHESIISPTLLNGWLNYGGIYINAGYFKDSLGFVHLKGLIKSGTIGANAFALPTGYRPNTELFFPVVTNTGFGYVTIQSSGNVVMSSGSNTWLSIEGICFPSDL